MKTFRVVTYNQDATYTVSLNESGVVDVDGLPADSAENLKASVARYIKKRGLMPVMALDLAVGSYSHLEDVDDSVADPS